MTKRLIIGISGASGFIYGLRALEVLHDSDIETHLIVSKAAQQTRVAETDISTEHLAELADVVHPINDISATLASGSFKTMGMMVAPCSIRALAEIAHGMTTNLLTRAADVVLKESRRLVLLVREAPLHSGHLQTMLTVSQMGAIIAPPVPAFYYKPQSIDDIVNHTVGRALDLFDLDVAWIKRWCGMHS